MHRHNDRGNEVKERNRHPHERAGRLLVCKGRKLTVPRFCCVLCVDEVIAKH
jgi:hypothetical protein